MAPPGQDPFAYALSSNSAWAGYKGHQNPEFFSRLASGQSPDILWLGCSDSRCPETTILGLQPGDVFVHRNIANIVSPTDINTAAVVEYAVAHLKVKHVVLCGHSGCGGALASLSDARVGGVLDTWLAPLKALRAAHAEELDSFALAGLDEYVNEDDDCNDAECNERRALRLAELNVQAGVAVLMANPVVCDAIEQRGLQVHGTFFDIGSGRIRDLGFGTTITGKGATNGAKAAEGVGGGGGGGSGRGVVRGHHAQLVFRGDGPVGMQAF
ncbi:hypothetical protein SLS62_004897 [Diatrype stigma]|uniref:Carbonic anhydrase n=1 Tax=Diatrype stigma TaxID=117547 RepID=A0AAN9V287_9PEZI